MNKEYTINGEPVTWKELIEKASEHGNFEDDSFRSTSEGAKILRAAGFTVDYNKDCKHPSIG